VVESTGRRFPITYDEWVASYPRVLTRRPRQGAVIDRDRLTSKELGGHITVICGPAGAGKSVLAGQLSTAAGDVGRVGLRVGWCRLAPGWNQAADIPGLLAASLNLTEFDEAASDPLVAAGQILDVLEAEPTMFVLDDVHEADGGEVERLLAEVGTFLPEQSAVVLTSRRRPAELIGLLDAGLVTVIDGDDLAFTVAEAEQLFAERDRDSSIAAELVEATGGWPVALAAAAESGDGSEAGFEAAVGELFSVERIGSLNRTAIALAAVPYLTESIAEALEVGGAPELRQLAEHSSLVIETGDSWRFHGPAATQLLAGADAAELKAWRHIAAGIIAVDDPITAIDLYISIGAAGEAGDLLAGRASEVGADRATRWLYQLPADVRRRLPPVLSGGRATVNVSLAILSARQQLESAPDDRTRAEGLLGLGSLLLADGDVGEAAEALEAGLRLSEHQTPVALSLRQDLALVRLFAGDMVGARAALKSGERDSWGHWLGGVADLIDGDLAAARSQADASVESADGADLTSAPGESLLAGIDLIEVGHGAARGRAARAYERALAVGGRDLAAAGPVYGWVLVRAGEFGPAAAVAEQIERTIGRHDFHARLHAALLRQAVSAADPTLGEPERDRRRVADLRSRGYAVVEQWSRRLAGESGVTKAGEAVAVQFCGSFVIQVDGTTVTSSAWKSRKAQEVCFYLAHAGPAGVRREQVIEAIWPDRDPEKGRTLLRTALSEIRRVLEPRRAAGQTSRFVTTDGDRVRVVGSSDISDAETAARAGDHEGAFVLIAAGLADEIPDNEWVGELRSVHERLLTECATRVIEPDVAATTAPRLQLLAHEALIAAEPWNKDRFDRLIAYHRSSGDPASAADVERRWFADD
jgi:DNA-binding SARP family transcriptional activator